MVQKSSDDGSYTVLDDEMVLAQGQCNIVEHFGRGTAPHRVERRRHDGTEERRQCLLCKSLVQADRSAQEGFNHRFDDETESRSQAVRWVSRRCGRSSGERVADEIGERVRAQRMGRIACMPEVMMPECDYEQLEVAQDEQHERCEVGANATDLVEDVGHSGWIGETRLPQVSREADSSYAIGAIVKDAGRGCLDAFHYGRRRRPGGRCSGLALW